MENEQDQMCVCTYVYVCTHKKTMGICFVNISYDFYTYFNASVACMIGPDVQEMVWKTREIF